MIMWLLRIALLSFVLFLLVACGSGGGSSPPAVDVPTAKYRSGLYYGYYGERDVLPETAPHTNLVWIEGYDPKGFWASAAAVALDRAASAKKRAVVEMPWVYEPDGEQRLYDFFSHLQQVAPDLLEPIIALAIPVRVGIPQEEVQRMAQIARRVSVLAQVIRVGQSLQPLPIVAIYTQDVGGFPGIGAFDIVGLRASAHQFSNGEFAAFHAQVRPDQQIVLAPSHEMESPEPFFSVSQSNPQVWGIVARDWLAIKLAARQVQAYCAVGKRIVEPDRPPGGPCLQ
jgi:hypothetical protein